MPEPRPQGHLLIGPPGSGKSTLAAILAPLLPARVIANDVLREQLWGDANVQGPWSELEPHLHGAIDRAIADGDNVLVDATHAQLNWRQGLMQRSMGPSTCHGPAGGCRHRWISAWSGTAAANGAFQRP